MALIFTYNFRDKIRVRLASYILGEKNWCRLLQELENAGFISLKHIPDNLAKLLRLNWRKRI